MLTTYIKIKHYLYIKIINYYRKEQFVMNEVKDKKGEFRCPETFKETYTNYCKQNKRNISEFIRDAITEKIERETSSTGLSPKANILLINKLYNITLAYSDILNKEYLEHLEKEIFDEYQYHN